MDTCRIYDTLPFSAVSRATVLEWRLETVSLIRKHQLEHKVHYKGILCYVDGQESSALSTSLFHSEKFRTSAAEMTLPQRTKLLFSVFTCAWQAFAPRCACTKGISLVFAVRYKQRKCQVSAERKKARQCFSRIVALRGLGY